MDHLDSHPAQAPQPVQDTSRIQPTQVRLSNRRNTTVDGDIVEGNGTSRAKPSIPDTTYIENEDDLDSVPAYLRRPKNQR